MLELYKPNYEDLWFRKQMVEDNETMSFNHSNGGTIDFDETKWNDWYDRWIVNDDNKFYSYLLDDETNEFVGEVAYHLSDDRYLVNVIIYSKYRGKGYGIEGLKLLCNKAKENNITELYDEIAIDNSSVNMFLKYGFEEITRNEKYLTVKKTL